MGTAICNITRRRFAPLGEAKSNWDVMRLLAAALGYDEPWLRQSAEEAIAEVLDATRATNPLLEGITLERLQAEGTVPLTIPPERDVPFADGHFPTPSGKVELRCDALAAEGLDPLPEYVVPAEFADRAEDDTRLTLIAGAAHHFVSSSLANVPSLIAKEGAIPWIEIHPDDAAAGASPTARWWWWRTRAASVGCGRSSRRMCRRAWWSRRRAAGSQLSAGRPQCQLDDLGCAGRSGGAEHVPQQPGGGSPRRVTARSLLSSQ